MKKTLSLLELVIDTARVEGADVFRLADWLGPVIVSERVRDALGAANVTGVRFISAMPRDGGPADRCSVDDLS